MSDIRLLEIKKLTGHIRVITGLHIGAGRESIEIGGMDNPIIKNPVTAEPYIPGSSLKGKLRSILEVATGNVSRDGSTHQCAREDCFICRAFGNTKDTQYGPTRIIMRDAALNKAATRENLPLLDEDFSPMDIIEEKYENTINRIEGKALNPRPQERVVPGVIFSLEILYKIFDVDGDGGATDGEHFSQIRQGLHLLELDYIGGNGSRGCGQIALEMTEPQSIKPQDLLEGKSDGNAA